FGTTRAQFVTPLMVPGARGLVVTDAGALDGTGASIRVFNWNGTGLTQTNSFPVVCPPNSVAVNTDFDVVTGDFNGDGRNEIVGSSCTPGTVFPPPPTFMPSISQPPKLNPDTGGLMMAVCEVCPEPAEFIGILDPVYLNSGEFSLGETDLKIPGR